MKIKIRPDDAGVLQQEDWLQTDDGCCAARRWPCRPGWRWPRPIGQRQQSLARSSAEVAARAEAVARAEAAAGAEMTERAVIGDQLRMPIDVVRDGFMHLLACRSRSARRGRHPGPRERRPLVYPCLGRAACPRRQQADPGFWATGPVVLWDRYTAVATAARAAAVRSDDTAHATWEDSGDPGRAARYPLAEPPEPGWQKPAPPFPRRWS